MTDYSGGVVETPFPAAALVPKAETGVLNFLQKYPQFDGRDVTIAIFDSGVDPRAVGLETLCDGKTAKVIERFDCTGCGDVDTSKKVTADAKGFITGLSGNQLKLTSEMIAANTANGEYHIGLKTFFDLCPSKVRERQIKIKKIKEWNGPHKTAIANVSRKIAEFDAQNSDTSKLSWDKKIVKDDLDFTLEMLNSYEKIYSDIKTTYDCIVYPTAKGWQAVVDISQTGDLEKGVHIGEYSKTYEVKNIDDFLSVSVNVHDQGNVLEVVGMCSPHGTHVASIAAGNHSSRDTDGMAPNAKIVSLTIGDGRLGSMETGSGLVRAMMKVMEMCREGRQIDVINMSYGEHSHWSNSGRIGDLMCEVVNKYGVVWVASAGNNGPALCTVGTPPDIRQPVCIGVGAYVSPSMMEAEYAMREKLPANVYTWTSRDPCIDGGQGVTVCAPGGAITSVPQFTMAKSQLMNGTSMAAPHVAGAVALLISGLKQKGIPYSPFSIKRAISVTATQLSYIDHFARGFGLLNTEKAFEHLEQYKDAKENMIRFSVRCGVNGSKGIHLRQGALQRAYEYQVNIDPVFMNEKEAEPKDKFNFNMRLNLIPTAPFVQCGSFLDLSYLTRSLAVKVLPSGLPPGVHTAQIRAYDTECMNKGSLFEIPVTIVQPHILNCEETRTFTPNKNNEGIEYQPNTLTRDFILVPKMATWAVLRLRSTDQNRGDKDIGKFFVHTLQLLPRTSCRKAETQKIVAVNSETDAILSFKVYENIILELCIAKYWSNFGSTHLKYSLEFHGVKAISPNAYVMHVAKGIHKMEVSALVHEEMMPQFLLQTATVVLKPTESKISPLSSTRDVIPEGRQIYQNLLTYSLNVPKAQDVALYAPLFNWLLYESEFESQLWMLFDSCKSMVASGDVRSHKFFNKLEKGEYTVRLQVRHEKRETLEKVNEANMLAVFKLANQITLDSYDHYSLCLLNGRKTGVCVLKDIPSKVLYIGPLPQEKLTKANLPANCAWLSGTASFAKDEIGRRVEAQEFTYILNPSEPSKKNGNGNNGNANTNNSASNTSIVSNNSDSNTPKTKTNPDAGAVTISPVQVGDGVNNNAAAPGSPKKKSTADEYAENLRDFQCSMIVKCELDKAEKIYEEVIAAHPKHSAAHLNLIQAIESGADIKVQHPHAFAKYCADSDAAEKKDIKKEDKSEDKKDGLPKMRAAMERIAQLADIVIKETDKDSLLSYYGLKCDTRADAQKIKTNMDKQKGQLLDALSKKGVVTAKLSVMDGNMKDRVKDIDEIYAEVLKFADANDTKVIQFSLWQAYAHKHYGRMYKYLQKLIDEKRIRENFDELVAIANSLEYAHLEEAAQRMAISAFPASYRLF